MPRSRGHETTHKAHHVTSCKCRHTLKVLRYHTWYKDHTVLPATNHESYLALLLSCRASLPIGWYSFPVPLRIGGWVAWGCFMTDTSNQWHCYHHLITQILISMWDNTDRLQIAPNSQAIADSQCHLKDVIHWHPHLTPHLIISCLPVANHKLPSKQ